MGSRNETTLQGCRFLSSEHFSRLYDTFIEAFSDYVFPFALTETQFKNHINLNGVDLTRTVGYEESNRLLGFSLNGFGTWNDRPTVYDAGTGVVPFARRKGISRAMFDFMLPIFRSEGIEQFLLEVITTNTPAINLYDKLGFRSARELLLLQCDGEITPAAGSDLPGLQIREIADPNWTELRGFWDGDPSWQNSISSVMRSRTIKRMLGAYLGDKCVGYIVFSGTFGRAAQLAVHRDHRKRGIGTALLMKMQQDTASGYSLQIINADRSLENTIEFFLKRGFYERLSQYEMLKVL